MWMLVGYTMYLILYSLPVKTVSPFTCWFLFFDIVIVYLNECSLVDVWHMSDKVLHVVYSSTVESRNSEH